jgi:alpha-1,2-mannosyltransferase
VHRKTYALVVLNFLLGAVGLHVATTALYHAGKIPEYCRGSVVRCIADLFRPHWAEDSWGPMLTALQNFRILPHVPIYQSTFFAMHVKFQYALATLLPFWALEQAGVARDGAIGLVNALSYLVVLATIAASIAVAVGTAERKLSPMAWGTVALLCLGFYPVMWAYQIGQIQLFGNLIFCLAFYLFLGEQEWQAGLLVGALVLMKPQFGLVVI